MVSEQEIRRLYGCHAIVSRKGRFTFVHLDRPSATVVRERTRRFNPTKYFSDDCPICRRQREEGGIVVFGDVEWGDDDR